MEDGIFGNFNWRQATCCPPSRQRLAYRLPPQRIIHLPTASHGRIAAGFATVGSLSYRHHSDAMHSGESLCAHTLSLLPGTCNRATVD